MGSPKSPVGVTDLMAIRGISVLLDTNILIQGTGAKFQEQRVAITDFCKQNNVCICDTVFYEFMRNCSLKTFRQRRIQVESWIGGKETPMQVLAENDDVCRTFENLWILYLYLMRSEPKRLIHLSKEDAWISAAAVHHKIDNILTTDDSGDYPSEVFSSRSFDLGKEKSGLILHLKTFRREAAREHWKIMLKTKSINVSFQSFAHNR